ncbi:MAG: phosphofructokinase, partial [Pseudonocardia sp.]|nr:phosphofructokinase [Pseudonocardia sp.]
ADLAANGRPVIADLSGEPLAAAVAGGATVIKVSHEELLREGRARDHSVAALVSAMFALAANGQRAVVCSRAEAPTLACFDGRTVEARGPVLEALDSAGAGDSFTAGMAAALAHHQPFETALRLGVAAGGLNVTRRGLGTGARDEIERLAAHVQITEIDESKDESG